MKTRCSIAVLITFLFVINNGFVFAQESDQEFDHVLQIEDTLSTKREWKSLMKAKKHQEHEVIIKIVESEIKLSMFDEDAYCLFYYYMEDKKLKADWIQLPVKKVFDRLYYKWEPTRFSFKFEDSKTGESQIMHRTFD